MERIEKSVDVGVDVGTAYNQWTQFEEFPRFMEGVESVQQIDDAHLLWTAEIGGQQREWRAEITEQHPDQRIAWRAEGGNGPNGVVSFHHIDAGTTRVTLQMDWNPEGLMETLGAKLGSDDRRVEGDLERFKELIEQRGVETGAWRGEIEQGETRR